MVLATLQVALAVTGLNPDTFRTCRYDCRSYDQSRYSSNKHYFGRLLQVSPHVGVGTRELGAQSRHRFRYEEGRRLRAFGVRSNENSTILGSQERCIDILASLSPKRTGTSSLDPDCCCLSPSLSFPTSLTRSLSRSPLSLSPSLSLSLSQALGTVKSPGLQAHPNILFRFLGSVERSQSAERLTPYSVPLSLSLSLPPFLRTRGIGDEDGR